MEEHECWYCGKTFKFNWDETHESCDVIEGQYTVFAAVICPHCNMENRW